MAALTEQVREIVRSYGGARMDYHRKHWSEARPPPTTYILAKSAITFALPLNKKFIRPFWPRRIA
jgi:hypothetical protein